MAAVTKPRELPSVDRLKELLTYDPETGDLRWRLRVFSNGKTFRKQAGKIAGGIDRGGYRLLRIDSTAIAAHRVAYAMMTGAWCDRDIDHADGDASNNRWSNLRPASTSQNLMNARLRDDNASGVKGVSRCRQTGRWAAELHANGRKIWLGRHDTLEQARAARDEAARLHHGEFFCDGHRSNLPCLSQQPAAMPRST